MPAVSGSSFRHHRSGPPERKRGPPFTLPPSNYSRECTPIPRRVLPSREKGEEEEKETDEKADNNLKLHYLFDSAYWHSLLSFERWLEKRNQLFLPPDPSLIAIYCFGSGFAQLQLLLIFCSINFSFLKKDRG